MHPCLVWDAPGEKILEKLASAKVHRLLNYPRVYLDFKPKVGFAIILPDNVSMKHSVYSTGFMPSGLVITSFSAI